MASRTRLQGLFTVDPQQRAIDIMAKRRKVLIIKTGFSEFLDRGISTTVSLGDVLICTALLHAFRGDEVTWVTDWQARQLLKKNPYVTRLLFFSTKTINALMVEEFDHLINLEKDIGICTVVNTIKAKRRFGFYFNDVSHQITTRKRSTRYLLSGQENQRDIPKNALELLYETIGRKWKGEGLILGNGRHARTRFDVGLNHSVGSKWPTKAWPMDHWKSLEMLLQRKYSVSWQQGHKNLVKYIEWINSCRVIVTSDSLGQAIGQALGKKVITLYGPTNYLRMQGIPNVDVISSTLNCPQMPCYMPYCTNKDFCMNYIIPEAVEKKCKEYLT